MMPLLRLAPVLPALLVSVALAAAPAPTKKAVDSTPEVPPASATAVWEPVPLSVSAPANGVPSDAIVLLDGKNLDSYDNATYVNGQAGSIYKQHAPLVNASRGPGEWQTYDVGWIAPRVAAGGKLASPARMTVFHNGVLVQHDAIPGAA